jgi:hypothetical protein
MRHMEISQSISLPFRFPNLPSVSDLSHPKIRRGFHMNASYNGNLKPPRKDCQYSPEEIEQIAPFKAQYIKDTKANRLITMKSKILPSMFNYWASQGRRPSVEEGPVQAQVSQNYSSRN